MPPAPKYAPGCNFRYSICLFLLFNSCNFLFSQPAQWFSSLCEIRRSTKCSWYNQSKLMHSAYSYTGISRQISIPNYWSSLPHSVAYLYANHTVYQSCITWRYNANFLLALNRHHRAVFVHSADIFDVNVASVSLTPFRANGMAWTLLCLPWPLSLLTVFASHSRTGRRAMAIKNKKLVNVRFIELWVYTYCSGAVCYPS
jgi:hypothetical protein